MDYTPHTDADIRRALDTLGLASLDDLFADIPASLLDPELDLPAALDETRLLRHLESLAARNEHPGPSFLGGGVRDHFIPAVTPALALQSAFVTSYTPYQAEVSQGLLQATFEYQTLMSELTGLPISNASMYDGATAVAEAALLAVRQTNRSKVVVSHGVHPESREVLATYLSALDVTVETVALDDLVTPVPALDDQVACVIAQQPNFLGYLERMPELAEAAHAVGALFVAAVDPLSLAVLAEPGSYGADIAVGDGQVLGNPTNFGGPHFGFMVVAERLLRQLPGRLVGQTTDVDGERAFVLTLQAREQHIRRSKAKSNICSNHQLAAVMATVNLSALGPVGLTSMARRSAEQAHALADALAAAGADVVRGPNFFCEFAVRTAQPGATVRRRLREEAGLAAGVPIPEDYGLGNAVLLAATERIEDEDIARLAAAFEAIGEAPGAAAPEGVAHG